MHWRYCSLALNHQYINSLLKDYDSNGETLSCTIMFCHNAISGHQIVNKYDIKIMFDWFTISGHEIVQKKIAHVISACLQNCRCCVGLLCVSIEHWILTHWSLGDCNFNFRKVIFKLTVVNGGWGISSEIALRWMPQDPTDGKSTLVQVMAWCRLATSHYLSDFFFK